MRLCLSSLPAFQRSKLLSFSSLPKLCCTWCVRQKLRAELQQLRRFRDVVETSAPVNEWEEDYLGAVELSQGHVCVCAWYACAWANADRVRACATFVCTYCVRCNGASSGMRMLQNTHNMLTRCSLASLTPTRFPHWKQSLRRHALPNSHSSPDEYLPWRQRTTPPPPLPLLLCCQATYVAEQKLVLRGLASDQGVREGAQVSVWQEARSERWALDEPGALDAEVGARTRRECLVVCACMRACVRVDVLRGRDCSVRWEGWVEEAQSFTHRSSSVWR
jgi:hypothetical protein